MLAFKMNKRGQNTAEYAILIALVVAAVVAMQTYVKRGLQGGVKFAVDKAGGNTSQYEPYYLQSSYNTTTSAFQDTEEMKTGGEVVRVFGAGGQAKNVTRTGSQTITTAREDQGPW